MTAVDRNFILGQQYDARRVQDSRAQLPAEKTKPFKRLQAEARSYTLSLLIDAINEGLLEQLHAEAEQRLYTDVAVDQDRAWAAYMAGMSSAPESTAPLAVPVGDDADDGDHFDPAAAKRVHFATDRRVERLAEASWRMTTGEEAAVWRTKILDDQRGLRLEARGWLRAAVAAGLLPPPPEPYHHSIDENAGVGPDLPDEVFDIADGNERLTMDEIEDGGQ